MIGVNFPYKIFLPFFSVKITLLFHLFYHTYLHICHAVAVQVEMGASCCVKSWSDLMLAKAGVGASRGSFPSPCWSVHGFTVEVNPDW